MVGAETRRAPLPDRAVAPLKVFLLGRFEVVRGDAPIPYSSWRRRRPADLLKLTALTSGRVLSRERVIETLWPDKDPSSGANNLHRALYDLRQILGGRFVDLEHGQAPPAAGGLGRRGRLHGGGGARGAVGARRRRRGSTAATSAPRT